MKRHIWRRGLTGFTRLGTVLSAALLGLCLGDGSPRDVLAQASATISPNMSPLARRYQEGESVAYKMRATNEGHLRTIRYAADAEGRVKRASSGGFIEEFRWTRISLNGQPVPLTVASQQFREDLSLSPEYKLSIPDLTKVQGLLIGPITDLLTFYVDVQLAMRQKNLVRPGDHVYMQHGIPNSWADGTYTVFGEDAVDFDLTLQGVDEKTQVATLVIRHVPPAQSRIHFPAAWMSKPVEGFATNWAEVSKGDGGKYVAEIGQETFEATIKLSLISGSILSATMNNPVDVLERDCDDAALLMCGAEVRYRIRRQIVLEAAKPEETSAGNR